MRKLQQYYCPNCGTTKTYAVDDDRVRKASCNDCLQADMKPILPAKDGGLEAE